MDNGFLLAWEAELAKEVGPEHALYRTDVKLIARRFDCDDALYLLDHGRVAEVHLTWRQSQEPDPRWPETKIFCSLEAWEQSGLAADHAQWLLDQA